MRRDCVDLYVVDCEIVDAGSEYGEVSAVQDADVANDDVARELQTDRFVSPTGSTASRAFG
jgi:carbamate kinase